MISKISPGVLPPDPFKQGRGREGRGEGGWKGRRGGEEERWVEGWEEGRERKRGGKGKGDVCIHPSGGVGSEALCSSLKTVNSCYCTSSRQKPEERRIRGFSARRNDPKFL
jgi:hypothetical protein